MSMKSGFFALTLIGASAALGTAFAAPVISVQNTGPSFAVLNLGTAASAGYQNSTTINDPGFGIASIAFSGGSPHLSGVYAGSVSGIATTPFPAGTPGNSLQQYLVAQSGGGTVTVTYNQPQTAFDVLWGTADTAADYNVVATNGLSSQMITGADITSSGSSGQYNYAVEVSNLNPFTTLTFSDSTSKPAFEFAMGSVPEPGTLALLAGGLVTLAWCVRRRKQKISC